MAAINDFCVFILSHGRAKNVKTYDVLRRDGYTGDIYVVIDDEDEQASEYAEVFGDNVLVFSKTEQAAKMDEMTPGDRRSVVYARNACFDLAACVGVRYFLELDDDYMHFEMRYAENGVLMTKEVTDLDGVFSAYIDFLKCSGAATVAMAQGGDFIGGCRSRNFRRRVLRKAMNSFFLDSKKRFSFTGRVNEDVVTYVMEGSRGLLMLTACDVSLVQKRTQSNAGGMSDVYAGEGTYEKSFHPVMAMPSCVTVAMMGDTHMRIHHNVSWDKAVPKILSSKYRKS